MGSWKKKQIIKVVIIPANDPSQVFLLFHRILLVPNLIPTWLVAKSLMELIPNIVKNTIGGQIKAANI